MKIAKLVLICSLISLLSLVSVGSVYSATLPDSPSDGSTLVNPDETDFSEDIFNNDFSTDVTDTATITDTTTDTSVAVSETTDTTSIAETTTLADTQSGSNTGIVIFLAIALSSLLLVTVRLISHKSRNVQ